MPKNALSARKIFANNLKFYRKQQNISQEKLAEFADLHRNYVGAVERGEINISVDNMEKLAKALDITICDFFESPNPDIEK